MKKTSLFFAFILLGISFLFSAPVDTATAKRVAINFWKQNNGQNRVSDFVYEPLAPTFTGFYVFNSTQEEGFVIVSADNRVQPILGYSEESTLDATNMPPNLMEWLMCYEQQIHHVINEQIETSEDVVDDWNILLEGGILAPKNTTSVNPLLTTQWSQGQYYNNLCPSNIFALDNGGRTVTGCVATAMAQIMKKWNYPIHGRGYHSYNCSYYGTQSANFANTTYAWSYMPNKLTSSSSTTQVNAVATLMYHCGVSVDMNYGIINGSSISDISLVVQALKNYFRYDASTHLVVKSNYTTNSAWINLLKNELDNGRPIFYVGTGGTVGHAFVCDGYNNSNYFHFNWGWGGASDGYFLVNNLNPSTYNFTNEQCAVIGIKPSNNTEPELEMYSTLSVNDTDWGSNITGTLKVLNTGNNSFSGYLAVEIFNEEGIAVDGQIFNVNNLSYNYYTTRNINISGNGPLIPGTYYAFALYSEDGNNWSLIPNGTNAYAATTFDITYSAPMETNSAFSNITFTQGQSATVNVDIWNSSSQTFYGKVRINLENIEDGSFIQNIQVKNITNGLQSNYHYTNGLDFTGTITVAPGTYLMSLAYQRDGETQWYYAGSSNYQNPVFVTVVAPPTLTVSPSSISFQQSGGSSVVNVTSNINWTATSSASWLTISPNTGVEGGYMIVSTSANNSGTTRSATITVTGSNGVSPQTITVSQVGSIQPDIYEPNNTASAAYLLGSVTSSSATIDANANFHITTDNDYYKINLPAGYSYTINTNILNSYNNSSYTADAKFATSLDGSTFSNNYGNSMPALTMNNGGTLYFRVLPYTDHEIGTYSLHISIQRTGGNTVDEFENPPIGLYPNPVSKNIYLTVPESVTIDHVEIYNTAGLLVKITNPSNQTIDVSDLSKGIYIIRIHTKGNIVTEKFVKM